MLEYKGFRGRVDIDNGEDAFTGEVDGIRDVVTFEGRTPVEVKIAFRASVEDYLAMGGAAPVPPAAPAVRWEDDETVKTARSLFNQECQVADTVYDADVQDRLDALCRAVAACGRNDV